MIPRHSPRALSSLTYINFFTRFEVRKYFTHVVCFPYSIRKVRRTLSLPGSPGLYMRRLSQPTARFDASHRLERSDVCCRCSVWAGTSTRDGQRNRPELLRPNEGLSSGRRAIQLRGSGSSLGVSYSSLLVPSMSVRPAVYCRVADTRKRVLVEPRRLELLTPSLQRRCSPN